MSLRKRSYDHCLTKKAYSSAITVTNISPSFYLQDGGKISTGIDMEQNYATVTLCVQILLLTYIITFDLSFRRVYG